MLQIKRASDALKKSVPHGRCELMSISAAVDAAISDPVEPSEQPPAAPARLNPRLVFADPDDFVKRFIDQDEQ